MASKPEAGSFKPLTISVEKLPASMGQQEAISSYAADRARLLLGCYRTGDANDPETYVAAIAAILARYPMWVITSVTHPASGLPSQKSWLPTVKEVTDACLAALAPVAEREARTPRVREQLAERERVDALPKPSYDDLISKYGKNFGMGAHEEAARAASAVPAPTADQLRHHYAHFKLQFKPKADEEYGF
jgi:hypothetical protein